MRILILLLALATPAEAHDDPEVRCLTRGEYAAKVLEPKARLLACMSDLTTEGARAHGLALDLRRSEAARRELVADVERMERSRWRWAGAGAAGAVAVLVGGALLVGRVRR